MIAGVDEVGRGAIAGPVSVGVVVIAVSAGLNQPPVGLADSKALTPKRREQLVSPIQEWASATEVGHASPAEIDDIGIVSALGLAGCRALAQVGAKLIAVGLPPPSIVILDGNLDWLTKSGHMLAGPLPEVTLLVGGDRLSATVAAASVIAKVERDALLVDLGAQFEQYGWASNKGYASATHRAALKAHGLSEHHRKSWRLTD